MKSTVLLKIPKIRMFGPTVSTISGLNVTLNKHSNKMGGAKTKDQNNAFLQEMRASGPGEVASLRAHSFEHFHSIRKSNEAACDGTCGVTDT